MENKFQQFNCRSW